MTSEPKKYKTSKKYETIIYEKDEEGIATITFNRPEARNAINPTLEDETRDAAADVKDDDRMRVLIITGAGTAFCSGYDVKQQFLDVDTREQRRFMQARERIRTGRDIFRFPFGLDFYKPYIAAVNGAACGDGFAYTLTADIRIASPAAKFSYLYVRRGITEGEAGTHYLPSLVGVSRAMEMMLSGEWVEAEEALKIGLVREVVPQDKLMSVARQYAHKLMQGAPLAQWAIKQMVIDGMRNPTVRSDYQTLWKSEDFFEAANAFVQKRQPKFKGR